MGTNAMPAPEMIVVKKRAFDLEKFENVTLETKVAKPAAPANMNEALAAVGGDASKLLELVAVGLRRNLIAETKKSLGTDQENIVFNRKAINTFVNLFRAVPPYKDVQDRKEQTGKILGWIKGQPELLAALKAAAAAPVEGGEEGEEEEEENS